MKRSGIPIRVAMAQKFLDRSDIVTLFQQMCSQGMAGAQGVAETVQRFRFLSRLRRDSWVSADWIGKRWCGVSLWHGPPSCNRDKLKLSSFFRRCQGPKTLRSHGGDRRSPLQRSRFLCRPCPADRHRNEDQAAEKFLLAPGVPLWLNLKILTAEHATNREISKGIREKNISSAFIWIF